MFKDSYLSKFSTDVWENLLLEFDLNDFNKMIFMYPKAKSAAERPLVWKKICEKYGFPEKKDNDGNSHLHWAVVLGKTKYLKTTDLKQINRENKVKETPLSMACANGDLEIIGILLDTAGIVINPEEFGHEHINPLLTTAKRTHGDLRKQVIQLLVSKGANIYDALQGVCEREQTKLIKIFLDEAANQDKALRILIETKNFDFIESCINKGADPNGVDRSGVPILDLSLKFEYETGVELIKMLVKNGAEETNRSFDLMKMLIKADEPELAKHFGLMDDCANLLLYACRENAAKVVKVIINDESITQDNLDKALMTACEAADYKIVEILIKSKADVNCSDANNKTPLYIACSRNDEELVKLLLDNGVDPNPALGSSKSTPLHVACETGSVGIVSLLLDSDAEVNSKDNWGKTPLQVVHNNNNENLKPILESKGADKKDLFKYQQRVKIEAYIKKRERGEHKQKSTFFKIPMGFSKSTKVEAANKLLNCLGNVKEAINSKTFFEKEKWALKTGKLGEAVKECIEIEDNAKRENVNQNPFQPP